MFKPYTAHSLTCVNISTDWGCHASFTFDTHNWHLTVRWMPTIPRVFLLCCRWLRLLSPIHSPALLPYLQQRLGLLTCWRCFSLLFHLLFHAVPLSLLNRFLTRAFYFSIAKVGQASCCMGRSHCLARKSFKDFGVQLLLYPNSRVILIEIFVGHLLTFSFLLLASGCMHCKN